LQSLRTPQQVARLRGLTVAQVLGIETHDEAVAEAAPAAPGEAPTP
jgi:hypothetical protein